jgi:hypothetical protein
MKAMNNHKWDNCWMCGPRITCGYCGNNCCNGGSGDDCPDKCASAYAFQDLGETEEIKKAWTDLQKTPEYIEWKKSFGRDDK